MKIAQYETCLSEFQWKKVEGFLPTEARRGRPRTCLRRVLNAILFVLKSGCPWRMLPVDFPPWKTVYHHFRHWSLCGLLGKINDQLRELLRALLGRNKHPSAVIIDSQTVRSDPHGGAVGYDAAKKTKGRKRFLCVDTLGYLLGLEIASADTPERCGAKTLLGPVLQRHRIQRVWADAGFSGSEFAHWVSTQRPGAAMEIIHRLQGVAGFQILPRRWVVERTFAWIIRHRRLVRDYEKSLHAAKAWVLLAMIRIMLNQFS
jgi:putative transposase